MIRTFQDWIDRDTKKEGLSPSPKDRLRLVTKRTVRWIDFCRPPNGYDFSDGDHGPQTAFYAYQWMIRTATARYGWSKERYHRGTLDSLSLKSSIGSQRAAPFGANWREDLQKRLWNAVLGLDYAAAWRRHNRVNIHGKQIIPMAALHFVCHNGRTADGFYGSKAMREAIDELFTFGGRTLNYSPNECHKRARWVSHTELHISPDSFALELDYGYMRDTGWRLRWTSNPGEPLLDFVCRAAATVRSILKPESTRSYR